MFFADKLTLGTPRRTKEGYMAVRARAARAGVYDYLGREIDPEGKHFRADQVVKVYRPEEEVFAKDSVHSFLLKPITDNHPSKPVTAENWDGIAKGVNAGAMRDGEYLAFDLVIMDKGTIDAIDRGKRELSNGYSSEISVEDGETPDGTHYDAVQRFIRGNHVAVVDKGRAGPECRIGDSATCDSIPVDLLERLLGDDGTYNRDSGAAKNAINGTPGGSPDPSGGGNPTQDGGSNVATKTITFDGMPIEATDQAEAAIRKLEGQVKTLGDAKTELDTKVGELTATVSTKDGEIKALEQKLKDAELSPAKLEQLVADRAALIGVAKAVDPNVVADGKTDAEIRRAVVEAKLGDVAKDMDDAALAGAFKVLAKDAKPSDPLRAAIGDTSIQTKDARAEYQDARETHRTALADAWRNPAPAAAA